MQKACKTSGVLYFPAGNLLCTQCEDRKRRAERVNSMPGMKYMKWPQTVFHERNYALAVTGSAPNAKCAFFQLALQRCCFKNSYMNFLSQVPLTKRHRTFCLITRSHLPARFQGAREGFRCRGRCFALNWWSQEASCVAFNADISC